MEEEIVKGRQLDLGSTVGVIATVALRKKVHRVGSLWSVMCPAFGFMYLFSFSAPVGFQPNREPLWGGYSTTLKSFYWGPYTSAFLHEFQVHGPVFIMGPFTFVFQLTTVHCWSMWNSCTSHCRFMISRFPCYCSNFVSCYYCFACLSSLKQAIFCCHFHFSSFIHLWLDGFLMSF